MSNAILIRELKGSFLLVTFSDLFNAAKSSQTKVQIAEKVCINKTPLAPIVGHDKPSTSNKILDATVPEAVKLKDSLIPLPSSVAAAMPDVHIDTKHSRHSHLETPATPVGISDKLPLLHSPSSSGVSDCGLRKDKKHKKKHKKSSECVSFERMRDDSSSRSDTSSKRKKKHKKDKKEKKYKKTDFASSDSDSYDDRKNSKKSSVRKHSRTYSNSSYSSDEGRHKRRQRTSDSENGYEWVEKTIETSNVRDSSSNTSSRGKHFMFIFKYLINLISIDLLINVHFVVFNRLLPSSLREGELAGETAISITDHKTL